jgi:putative transposase
MIRITLSTETRQELQTVRRDPSLSPGERDRVEMLMLSSEGWSVPRIATHLGYHPKTVRLVLKGFTASGTAGIRHRPPGPAPNTERRERITSVLDRLLAQERTWTAAQLAEALTQEGFALSARQTRKYLKAMGARWRRTVRTLAHKQDEQKVERARTQLSALKKRPLMGEWS